MHVKLLKNPTFQKTDRMSHTQIVTVFTEHKYLLKYNNKQNFRRRTTYVVFLATSCTVFNQKIVIFCLPKRDSLRDMLLKRTVA